MLGRGRKNIKLILLTLTVVAVGVLVYSLVFSTTSPAPSLDQGYPATSTDSGEATAPGEAGEGEVIGRSVEGRAIRAYTFGAGSTHLLFVGGIHGGYEWNSVLLAYEMIDYLEENPAVVPDNITVSIIPSANPDGLYEVLGQTGRFSRTDVPAGAGAGGTGRFNANGVDLNRNFDCNWQPDSTWRGETVSAGSSPFSEPEAQAIRDFVQQRSPEAAVFWHSQANAVYASECNNGVLPETLEVMNTYAQAAGYRAVESFDAYPITGDVEGWLASIGIPAVTVELSTHETLEWQKNLAGVRALFDYYNQSAS